jgi:L-rhamnonate dehydratase
VFEGITAQVYKNAPLPKNGCIEIPDLPGLGLELNTDFIQQHDEKG